MAIDQMKESGSPDFSPHFGTKSKVYPAAVTYTSAPVTVTAAPITTSAPITTTAPTRTGREVGRKLDAGSETLRNILSDRSGDGRACITNENW